MSIPILDIEARRLLWRCRRGMKELDILLERFARCELSSASREQRDVFARFLDFPDPVLVDYLLGQGTPPEPELAELARRIAAPPSAPVPSSPGLEVSSHSQCHGLTSCGSDPENR